MSDIITYLDGATGVTEKIKKAMYDAARQFVYIGFLLWEVQQYEYFKEKGYKDVYEYAEEELNFKKSSTKNFIAICKEFSKSKTKNLGGNVSVEGQEISMNIADEYQKFNYSQLTEMLALAPSQRVQVTPDMTVKQIREFKKQAAAELKEDNYIIADYEVIPEPEPEPIKERKANKAGQTSGQNKILIIPDEKSKPDNGGSSTLTCKGCFYLASSNGTIDYRTVETNETVLVSTTVNNIWEEVPLELIKQLCKIAGIKETKNMCFDITIKKHEQ